MSHFLQKEKRICLRERDVKLILFLAEYGSITNENVKLLYESEYYYKNRLASLAKGDMIERLYGKVVLSRKGKRYLNEIGIGYRNINRDENYKKRMERISDIACKVQSCGWYFEPSWKCDVNTYTKRGNRYVGVMSREEKSWGESFEDLLLILLKWIILILWFHLNIIVMLRLKWFVRIAALSMLESS